MPAMSIAKCFSWHNLSMKKMNWRTAYRIYALLNLFNYVWILLLFNFVCLLHKHRWSDANKWMKVAWQLQEGLLHWRGSVAVGGFADNDITNQCVVLRLLMLMMSRWQGNSTLVAAVSASDSFCPPPTHDPVVTNQTHQFTPNARYSTS